MICSLTTLPKGDSVNPRLRRLQADFEHVRDVYSGHPHVQITPLGDRLPPESYRVVYKLRGLSLDGDQPQVGEVHPVEIMLPLKYPAEKPYAVPLEPIFHPNIREYFCIADYWAAGTTLVDVIAKMGDMIQWRIYNPASPLDAIAARWAVEQEPNGLFPIGNVNLGVADFDITLVSAEKSAPDEPERERQTIPVLDQVELEAPPAAPTSDVAGDDFDILIKASDD